jgi:hypothetical protein
MEDMVDIAGGAGNVEVAIVEIDLGLVFSRGVWLRFGFEFGLVDFASPIHSSSPLGQSLSEVNDGACTHSLP